MVNYREKPPPASDPQAQQSWLQTLFDELEAGRIQALIEPADHRRVREAAEWVLTCLDNPDLRARFKELSDPMSTFHRRREVTTKVAQMLEDVLTAKDDQLVYQWRQVLDQFLVYGPDLEEHTGLTRQSIWTSYARARQARYAELVAAAATDLQSLNQLRERIEDSWRDGRYDLDPLEYPDDFDRWVATLNVIPALNEFRNVPHLSAPEIVTAALATIGAHSSFGEHDDCPHLLDAQMLLALLDDKPERIDEVGLHLRDALVEIRLEHFPNAAATLLHPPADED